MMKRNLVWRFGFGFALMTLLGAASMGEAQMGTWQELGEMPNPREAAASAVVAGKIYIIGGDDESGNPNSAGNISNIVRLVEEYDPATETWTRKADMPTPRYRFSASAVDGIIYAIGGWAPRPGVGEDEAVTASTIIASPAVEAYDPATDTWTRKADLRTARANLATSAVNGKIYAIGGNDNAGAPSSIAQTVEEYDPVTDTWTEKG